MTSAEGVERGVHISVSDIGGIEETDATFEPGVTVLAGRNATNRTSLLRAIMAGLGSTDVALKADADEGHVELTVDRQTYTRTLTRENGTTVFRGDPFLDDASLADLFAFLLESNEARRSVARAENLHELIMRPVDTAEIETEIRSLIERKQQLDERISEIETLERDLPELERRLADLDEQIETKEAALADKESELESLDANVEETQRERDQLDEKLDTLRARRTELEETRAEIERKQTSLESLEERKTALEDDEEDLPETPVEEIQEIDARIDRLHREQETINSTINEIQTIIQFNEDKLESADNEILDALGVTEQSSDAVTDRLVEEGQTVCWTCGSTVGTSSIEETLDALRGLNGEKRQRKREIETELEELAEQKETYRETQHRREQIDRELTSIEAKIDQHEARIETLRERRDDLEAVVADLEDAVEQLESEEYSDILERNREVNELEFELDQLRDRRDDVRDELESTERKVDEKARIEEERADVQDELERLRTKIDRIEDDAIEKFNNHMNSVLSILKFDNIERIWIEKTTTRSRRGQKNGENTRFDLHVVRSNETGASYEDRIDNLSESERETTGLVFALAGYLVHEVYEEVPFILLDSLEAIDSERIAALVDYLGDYPEYLVVALLEEDAAALDPAHRRISEI